MAVRGYAVAVSGVDPGRWTHTFGPSVRFVSGVAPVMPEFVCGAPDCTFEIRANDADEIVEHVRQHAREKHDRDVDEERVRDRIEE